MNLELVTAPAAAPVELEELKRHLRLTVTDHDETVQECLDGAVDLFDGRDGCLGRALVQQTWALRLRRFPSHTIELPLPPLKSVSSITYFDADNVEQTVDPSAYLVHPHIYVGEVEPAPGCAWPTALAERADAVRIEFVCGYGDAAKVPAQIRQAIRMIAVHNFRQPEPVVVGAQPHELPLGVRGIVERYRAE